MVPALEYVLKPTCSSMVEKRGERSSTIVLVDKTGDSTCRLRDSKDHYLYVENNRETQNSKTYLSRQELESNNNPSTTATSNRTS